MIHLDTSFLIGALGTGSREAATLAAWLDGGEAVGISAICWAEFLCGPLGEPHLALVRTILGNPSPFGAEAAGLVARLHNETGRRRGAFVDCIVAAAAMTEDAALATSNARDFTRFQRLGLRLATR